MSSETDFPTFQAHTTVVFDFLDKGVSIQTSGLKIIDHHITVDNQLYILLDPAAGV